MRSENGPNAGAPTHFRPRDRGRGRPIGAAFSGPQTFAFRRAPADLVQNTTIIRARICCGVMLQGEAKREAPVRTELHPGSAPTADFVNVSEQVGGIFVNPCRT